TGRWEAFVPARYALCGARSVAELALAAAPASARCLGRASTARASCMRPTARSAEDPALELDQLRVGRSVRFARLRPGDPLFTEGGGHVQFVVSKRVAISAPQTGECVRYAPLAQLRPEFAGARRVVK